MSTIGTEQLDGIPVLWVEPDRRRAGAQLVVWLPPLSMPKENLRDALEAFARIGFVAVTFDAWLQGARTPDAPEAIRNRVFGDFRRQMWPRLGQTTLEVLRVLDWASSRFEGKGGACVGGVSLGGDVAVAAAGVDRRIQRVAAIVATPDWLRPGMTGDLGNGRSVDLRVGAADSFAQYFYDTLNPMTHLQRYVGGAEIAFECGADDRHVPAEAALRFQEGLEALEGPGRVRVTIHDGVPHWPFPPTLFERCVEWLSRSA